MRRVLMSVLILAVASLSSLAAASPSPDVVPERIVSLAPSITDLLFALEVGERVVGVTDWCVPPPEAAGPARIGGHVDPNLEAVLALRPDLVVVEAANAETADQLTRLGLTVCVVEHRHVKGIVASVMLVGDACGISERAAVLRKDIGDRLAAVVARRGDRPRPRVMLVVGREAASGRLSDLYLAGGGTFLGEMLVLAGGENVIDGTAVNYPMISLEGLMRLAPDVVVDLAPECADDPRKLADLEQAWRRHRDVPAVSDGRVHVLTDPSLLVPGPRFVDTLELLSSILDPE